MNNYLKELLIDEKIPVVFDYDGVLFEMHWCEYCISTPEKDDRKMLDAMLQGKSLYTLPLAFMQKFVEKLKHPMYVLAHTFNSIEYSFKKDQIKRYYTNIGTGNVINIRNVDDKRAFLNEIVEKYGTFIYIDSDCATLIEFEKEFKDCHFFHLSSLLVREEI